jgi:hypothetical protein
MSAYNSLYSLIYVVNRARYEKLSYCWDKQKTIKHLTEKIPELKTSFIKEVKLPTDIELDNFVLKNSHGHSSRNVYVFYKIADNIYYELLRKKTFHLQYIQRLVKMFKNPFIENNFMVSKLPIDIKVHVFFGKVKFFYMYFKDKKKYKSRYDSKLDYIPYPTMFLPNSFNTDFQENKNLIEKTKSDVLNKLLEDSVEIFKNLDNLVYCSIDWLYDYENHNYYFCELTPTPYVLSKYVKQEFIKKYITNDNI